MGAARSSLIYLSISWFGALDGARAEYGDAMVA